MSIKQQIQDDEVKKRVKVFWWEAERITLEVLAEPQLRGQTYQLRVTRITDSVEGNDPIERTIHHYMTGGAALEHAFRIIRKEIAMQHGEQFRDLADYIIQGCP